MATKKKSSVDVVAHLGGHGVVPKLFPSHSRLNKQAKRSATLEKLFLLLLTPPKPLPFIYPTPPPPFCCVLSLSISRTKPRMAGCSTSAALGVLLLLCCSTWAAATDYTVGDSTGWTNGFDYSKWTTGKTFVTGDTLMFNYVAGVHTVDQVSATDYSSCSASNALSTDSNGQTTVTLSKAGTYYFICGVAGHCSNGMKVAVPVTASSTSSPSPPSSSTTTPPSPGTTPSTTTPSTNKSSPRTGSLPYMVTLTGLMLLKLLLL
ncbi:unnamed protein product [Musa textilis]